MTATTLAPPVVRRLRDLAIEFDAAAAWHSKYASPHAVLLRDEAARAARQLRCVAERVERREYSQAYGAVWLRAAWRIITAIGRTNLT